MIILIAACSKNGVIGNNNQIPWHLPEDLKRFKKLTSGNAVVMGSKTFRSLGKPLKDRTNIVLTRDYKSLSDIGGTWDFSTFESVEKVLNLGIFKSEIIYIIGGAQIYKEFMPYADKILLTYIDKEFEGDTFFPEIDKEIWYIGNKIDKETPKFKYSYLTYIKKNSKNVELTGWMKESLEQYIQITDESKKLSYHNFLLDKLLTLNFRYKKEFKLPLLIKEYTFSINQNAMVDVTRNIMGNYQEFLDNPDLFKGVLNDPEYNYITLPKELYDFREDKLSDILKNEII